MPSNNEKLKYNVVFNVSIIISIIITAYGLLFGEGMGKLAGTLMHGVTVYFGWFYLLLVAAFVVFNFWMAFGRYGSIVLGPDGSKPEFSTISWFAMLFGSGMGIGIIFWGFAEPITHFAKPPFGLVPGSEAAAQFSMLASFMHWALHPWSCFGAMGLALAYFQFRKGYPGLISSLFVPLIGKERVAGPIGKLIDIIAVIATILGVCTSLGLGTMQINGGLSYLLGVPNSPMSWLAIVVAIAFLYIWTAVSGVDSGIKLIGNINLALAMLLLVASFIVGPTLFDLNILTNTIGSYFQNIIIESFKLNTFGDNDWTRNWRVFYWAWWLAWAPFVGTFIARISKGRTIREFVLGVMIIPSIIAALWFSVMGGLGLNLINIIGLEKLTEYASSPETAFVNIFAHYPFGTVLDVIVICLVATFFVTSANSATYVLGMLTDNGAMFPAKKKLLIWGILQAIMAYSLMLSGGLTALQTASIAGAFPFLFVMIGGCAGLVLALSKEKLPVSKVAEYEEAAEDNVADLNLR